MYACGLQEVKKQSTFPPTAKKVPGFRPGLAMIVAITSAVGVTYNKAGKMSQTCSCSLEISSGNYYSWTREVCIALDRNVNTV